MKLFLPLLILFTCLTGGCGLTPAPAVLPTLAATLDLPSSAPLSVSDPTADQAGSGIPGSTAAAAAPAPGPIWVTNPADRTVLRIDPDTNSIAAVVTVQGKPYSTATGEGGVWVLDRERGEVLRIDEQDNQVQQVIALPDGDATAITAAAGAVWVAITGRIAFEEQEPAEYAGGETIEFLPPARVVQIDPNSGKLTGEYAVQPADRLEASGSALYVLSHGIIDTPLQVIDLVRGQGLAVPFRNAPEWMLVDALAVDENSLWLFSTAYGKIFHATADGRIHSAVELDPRRPSGQADLLRYGDDLWAATPWGTVLRIHARTNQVLAQVDLDVPLTRLIAGNGAVWALSQQQARLFRLDLQTAAVTAQIETGSRVQPTVVPSPTPRVVVWRPCPNAANSRLKVGDLAYVTKDPPVPNRVREAPNTEAEILGHITPGGSMTLIEGPQCANNWVWWKVKNADLEGWTAEGDQETYWLVPLFP